MKHIAFYIGSLSKGGSERTFVNLAEYFFDQGYKVTIVTQYKKENEYTYREGIERILSDLTEEETTKSRILNFIGRYQKLRKIWKALILWIDFFVAMSVMVKLKWLLELPLKSLQIRRVFCKLKE